VFSGASSPQVFKPSLLTTKKRGRGEKPLPL
jgi:hypothetical protein